MFNFFSQGIKKVRAVGPGFVFETIFERIVPCWLFRFCSVAIYELQSEKLSAVRPSVAKITICDNTKDLELLREMTGDCAAQECIVGVLAKIDDSVAGGIWIAVGDYQDYDLGLSFSLGEKGAWLYSARVESDFRRRGIYSHLMAASAQATSSHDCCSLLIGVSELNTGSRKAIERLGVLVGKVQVLRVGCCVWARTTGGVKQESRWSIRCVQRPVKLSLR